MPQSGDAWNARPAHDDVRGTVRRIFAASTGIYVIVVAIVLGLGSIVALGLIATIATKAEVELPGLVAFCLQNRLAAPLLALPALALGVALLRARRGTMLLLAMAIAALVLPLAVTLYCFIAVVGPMYGDQTI